MIMKNLLFLGVGFYSYDQAIIQELSSWYNVTYLNLNLFQEENRALYSFLCRIRANSIIKYFSKQKVKKRLEVIIGKRFDKVFIIKGSFLFEESLSLITKHVGLDNIYLYLWDSARNIDNISVLKQYIRRIYSFDNVDCKKNGFKYRPLFCVGHFGGMEAISDMQKRYDLSFVGINHSDRIVWLSNFYNFCNNNKLVCYFFLSAERRLILKYRIKQLLTKNRYPFLHSDTLSYKKYVTITHESRAVVDFPNQNQSGLTIRSIEALCLGVKLITTNNHIKDNDDIPSSLYYCITDVNQIDEQLINFINSEPTDAMPNRYFIEGFLTELGLVRYEK